MLRAIPFIAFALLSGALSAQLKFTVIEKPVTHFDQNLGDLDLHQHIFQKSFNIAESDVGKAQFNLSEFWSTGDFVNTTFHGKADIDNAQFDSLADFMRARFKGQANFGGTHFNDELVAEGTIFEDDALFFNAEFAGRTNFLIARFKGYSHFSNATFDGRTSFSNAVFSKAVSFKSSRIHDELIFTNTVFMDDVDFSNVTDIAKRIDLTVIKTDTIRKDTTARRGINLTNSDISKFKIDYSLLYLTFDSSASFEYRSNAYQSLLNNFRNDGYTESYELLDKEFKQMTYAKKGAWFIHGLDKYWWDYGYAKHYVFYWSFVLVALFTLLNFFIYPFLQRSVYSINHIEVKFTKNAWSSFWLRFYYSLVYTSVLFFSISVKLDNLKYRNWMAVAYIFTIYVLGVICLAYIANFVITK